MGGGGGGRGRKDKNWFELQLMLFVGREKSVFDTNTCPIARGKRNISLGK